MITYLDRFVVCSDLGVSLLDVVVCFMFWFVIVVGLVSCWMVLL